MREVEFNYLRDCISKVKVFICEMERFLEDEKSKGKTSECSYYTNLNRKFKKKNSNFLNFPNGNKLP